MEVTYIIQLVAHEDSFAPVLHDFLNHCFAVEKDNRPVDLPAPITRPVSFMYVDGGDEDKHPNRKLSLRLL